MSSSAEDEELQNQVESFWNATPCDSGDSTETRGSVEYFRDIEDQRYQLQWHIVELLSSLDLQGKRVLEIGTGVGTDARTIVGMGAEYSGINVDAGSCEISQKALDVFKLAGEVRQASALSIPYPDATFDVVYSFGVLIVIPDAARAIQEIRRVLKPGGVLVIMLYNRTSVNYSIEIRHLRRWGLRILGVPGMLWLLDRLGMPRSKLERHLELRRNNGAMSEAEWLSRNTDGPDNPYARVYNEAETQSLLAGFDQIHQYVRFFDHRHWGVLGRAIPARTRKAIGRRWGWHRIAIARKPV